MTRYFEHGCSLPGKCWEADQNSCPVFAVRLPGVQKCGCFFTKYGFYSAVCAREGSGRQGQPVNPNRIMVRARLRTHLEALQDRFPELLGGSDIKEFMGTDYAFRIFVDKPVWAQVVIGLTEELNYDNFKSEVARFQGREGAAYEESLHEVWSVMYRLQR